MLLALGAIKLGSRLRPVLEARVFHCAYLFLGLDEWACAPIFKPYQCLKLENKKIILGLKNIILLLKLNHLFFYYLSSLQKEV